MPALRTRDIHPRCPSAVVTTTDVPQPPALNILSPTPRTFTFPIPITHDHFDTDPCSSPSISPFEPDLHPLTLHCTTPPSSLARPFSPDSPLRSSSPSSPEHKRRKSCSSDLVERRPKKGDEDYIKRPENAFILFRRKCCEDRQQAEDVAAADGPTKKQRQADLSKTISQQWKSLSAEERQFWEQMAKDKKKEHEQLYPNYVYRPQRAKDKDGKMKNKKTKKSEHEDTGSVSFVVPVHRQHGRSASAPTPPPYQSIQVPNVYHLTPPCPTSPSLLPMISRRSAHPGHPEEVMSNFDYLPNNMPSSFPLPGQFEASLQSSDFLRNMFSTPRQRNSQLPHLHQLSMPEHSAFPLSANQIASPSSSIGSNSSGPSSPTSGPYTPVSVLPSENYVLPDPHDTDAQAQAAIDLQMEMQIQQDFAAYSWGNNGSLWGSDSVLLRDDFDLSSISPIEFGVPKYTENLTFVDPNASRLQFVLEEQQYLDDSQNLGGFLDFDEMMARHGF